MANIFRTIFKVDRLDTAAFARVDEFTRLIPTWKSYPDLDRRKAHYRFYCDNDDWSRWRLREDPDEPWPDEYVEEAFRGEGYGEFQDVPNGMLSLGLPKCHDPSVQVATYTTNAYIHHYISPFPRTLFTICDSHISRSHNFQSIRYLSPARKLREFINSGRSGRLGTLDLFQSMTSVILLHEIAHAWPFLIHSQKSPTSEDELALNWRDVQLLDDLQSLQNAQNYVYYCLIAELADLGWRVELGPEGELSRGILIEDPSVRSGEPANEGSDHGATGAGEVIESGPSSSLEEGEIRDDPEIIELS
ncbi:MAG: hypothetical protein Q9227_008847 [Pyrenula ochraceoflavens]